MSEADRETTPAGPPESNDRDATGRSRLLVAGKAVALPGGDKGAIKRSLLAWTNIKATDLPADLSCMQAVAWIVTRTPAVVLRASFDREDFEWAVVALGEEAELFDDQPGITMQSIDLLLCQERADSAIKALVDALQRGEVVANAIPCDATGDTRGDRREMSKVDWRGRSLANPGDDRTHHDRRKALVPVMIPTNSTLVAGEGDCWADVRIDTQGVLAKWPELPAAVTPTESSLLPPEWVKVADLGRWIEHYYGVSDPAQMRDFKLYLRSKTEHSDLHYRIGRPLGVLSGPGGSPPHLFLGGTRESYFRGQRIAKVDSWQCAAANMETVTVRGKKLAIFVLWADAQRWFDQRLFLLDEPPDRLAVTPPARRTDRAAPLLSSGAPGRPTSMHLVEGELRRMQEAGRTFGSKIACAQTLADWLKQKHPEAPPLTAKTILNRLRNSLPGRTPLNPTPEIIVGR